MPELPEVTIMTENIASSFKKCELTKIKVVSGKYKTKSLDLHTFKPGIITDVRNKGKFIYFVLNNNITIWITLGLTGELSTNRDSAFSRIVFKTSCGNIYFNDMRNFGTVSIHDHTALQRKLHRLGPDPLYEFFPYITFINQYNRQNQKQKIGDVLLKQDFVAGIGNYLRAEILYDAKISPHKQLKDISSSLLKRLYQSIVNIIKASYKYQKKHGLHTYPFKIYRQRFDPEGYPIIGEPFKNKRTMWWSPEALKN